MTAADMAHLRAIFSHRIGLLSLNDDKHQRDPLLDELRDIAGRDLGYAALIAAISKGFLDYRYL